MINSGKTVTIDMDSELHMSKCHCNSRKCDCIPYAIPLRCQYGLDRKLKETVLMDLQQRKGEAEMAQVDWLIQCLPTLRPGEACLSVVLFGDINAIVIHMLALSYLWPRDRNGDFLHHVFVILVNQIQKICTTSHQLFVSWRKHIKKSMWP